MKSRQPLKPYEALTMDSGDFEQGLTLEIVQDYIELHKQHIRRYEYLRNLYVGFYDLFREPENASWKPDNRLVVNFARDITDSFVGYAYGLGITETTEDEKLNDSIQEFRKDNEMDDHEVELAKYFCEYGHCFEYFYQDEDARTKVIVCAPTELFVVYDRAVRRRALFAVRYGYTTDSSDMTVIQGEILTRDSIRRFYDQNIVEEYANPYGYIPVVEYIMNEERLGIYEGVANLIESYNHTISEKANDVDAFADAYLAVLGAELDEEGLYKIRDNRIINLYGTDNARDVVVQFLQKPTADGTQEHLLDRLESQIYQKAMVVNFGANGFGANESGDARAYRLLQMDNLAAFTNKKFKKSIMKRYKIFCALPTNSASPDAWQDVEIVFNPNVPKNITEEITNAKNVAGIVSKKTQLSLLSIVDDPESELERIDEEKESSLANSNALRGLFMEEESVDGSETES